METERVKLINLTQHTVDIHINGQDPITIPPSGMIASVEVYNMECPPVSGIPIVRTLYGRVLNLPDPEPGTIYIVSSLVAKEVMGQRDDILAPDTGPSAVRNARGKVEGVRRLKAYAYTR